MGVEHRLEFVRELHGVRWYNDSIATAPERVIAAIHSFEEPLILILGGRDKNLSWTELATLVSQRVKHLIVFGEAVDKIIAAMGLRRQDVFICNVLKCRPPENRDPKPEEIIKCIPLLERQLEIIKPKIIWHFIW